MHPVKNASTSRAAALAAFAALGLCAALVSTAALAELSNDILIGPGLRSRPAYDGAASQHTEVVPVIRYFGPWVFVRSTQGVLEGGLRIKLTSGLHAAVQAAYEGGRRASESDFLARHAVADIQRGASLGLQVEWDHSLGPMPLTLLVRARQHTDADQGAQVDLRLSAGLFKSGPLSGGMYVQAIWANAKSMGAQYGITAQQSSVTGLPPFGAGSGWLAASVGLLGSLDLSPQWVVVGSLEARRLRGDAASSPLVERRSNHFLNAGLAYRF